VKEELQPSQAGHRWQLRSASAVAVDERLLAAAEAARACVPSWRLLQETRRWAERLVEGGRPEPLYGGREPRMQEKEEEAVVVLVAVMVMDKSEEVERRHEGRRRWVGRRERLRLLLPSC
jgi:hypothetical protein